MDLTGRHLGKYELLEKVGQGGMAYVYKAHQPTIDRTVAVKVLHSHLADDAEFLERFKREAQGLGSLSHPHIVSIIDFDVDDGWYYMVMDYIEGDTLEAYLDQQGKLPVAEALRLTVQLAGALAYAHDNGRIHRDIKPGNIMFADSSHQHAVITDFGLTRMLDSATITLSGTIAGTPAYMSPEAAQGHKVDGRSDIYSLGMILYEMVTGHRPFAGETPLSIIMKLVIEPLPSALSINPDLPPVLELVLQRAMTKQPEDRYQTAAALSQALQQVARGGVPVMVDETATDGVGQVKGEQTQLLPPKPGSVGQAQPSKRRSFLPLAASVSLLIILVITGFVFLNGNGAGAEGQETTLAETAVPTLTVAAQEPTPLPVAAGTLRFAEPDGNNLRQYTLSLDNVPPPPAGFHYELWFDFADQATPENVAEVVAQNGRITYADVLVENLAATITGSRISLEPDLNDDPAISVDVLFVGTLEADAGLAAIEMFGVGELAAD